MLRFFLQNFRILPKLQLRRHLVEFVYVLPIRRVAHQKCCMAFMNLIGFFLDFLISLKSCVNKQYATESLFQQFSITSGL